jgi:acetylornithine aminotransferase/acetylornithine/N-succinyldiaminopimelate aminotransferase
MSHVSNLYYVKEQADLGERIASITPRGLSKSLFVNSGAEANEGALKLAVRSTGRCKVLSALNSFHGRTAGSLGATGQVKYQDTFRALISSNFGYFDFGDAESFKSSMTKDTAAVLLEPIQGEGGVQTATREFFRAVRDICTDNGTVLIMDEVQTGMGRTGKWCGIDNFGVVPDVITLAKGLGGGVPIGAVVTTEELSATFTPGTHGTTFGGNPLVCAAACAVIDIIKTEKLLNNAKELGAEISSELKSIGDADVKEVRGLGLMIGIEMKTKAKEFRDFALTKGVLVNVCHDNVVRLLPPLIIGRDEKEMFIRTFREFIGQ